MILICHFSGQAFFFFFLNLPQYNVVMATRFLAPNESGRRAQFASGELLSYD